MDALGNVGPGTYLGKTERQKQLGPQAGACPVELGCLQLEKVPARALQMPGRPACGKSDSSCSLSPWAPFSLALRRSTLKDPDHLPVPVGTKTEQEF